MDITKKAIRNLKAKRESGSAASIACFENKKLSPNITEVVIADNIGSVSLRFVIIIPLNQ